MSRRLLQGQIAPRNFIPDGIYPTSLANTVYGLLKWPPSSNAYQGALDEMQLIRFTVIATSKLGDVTFRVDTAGGGSAVARVGVYRSLDFGEPGELIVDCGTASVTSTGNKTITIDRILIPGVYYLAFVAQTWTTTRPDFRGVFDTYHDMYIPADTSAINVALGIHSVAVSGVSGALPSTAGTIISGGAGRRTPYIVLGISRP